MIYSNYPSHNESNEQFEFNISRELLLDPNDIIMGEMVGEGGSSMVYKGMLRNEFPVAVKIVDPSRTSTLQDKEKFQREVLLLSKMEHDNVVKFVGACIEPKLMIVTELVEGGSLKRFMSKIYPRALDLEIALSFALDISRAMEFLHSKGIIHRDLNPRNLLVTGDMIHLKLADFGIAREEATDGMTCEAGTYRWMAPEVCSRGQLKVGEKKHYTHKADVYSFALVLWQLLTNKLPFHEVVTLCIPYLVCEGGRPSLADIPYEIVPILESCWAEDPNVRPEFKEITVLLTNLLRSLGSDTSTDTRIVIDEEAYDGEIDESDTTSLIQEHSWNVENPQEKPMEKAKEKPKEKKKKNKKKKKVAKMMRPFFKMFKACYKP